MDGTKFHTQRVDRIKFRTQRADESKSHTPRDCIIVKTFIYKMDASKMNGLKKNSSQKIICRYTRLNDEEGIMKNDEEIKICILKGCNYRSEVQIFFNIYTK